MIVRQTSGPFQILSSEGTGILWRLKDIEGMSRSEIVEQAIIRLARDPRRYPRSLRDPGLRHHLLAAAAELIKS